MCPRKTLGDLNVARQQRRIRLYVLKMRIGAFPRDQIAIRVTAREMDVWQGIQTFQYTARVVSQSSQIPYDPILVRTPVRLYICQNGIQRNGIAMDIGQNGNAHVSR